MRCREPRLGHSNDRYASRRCERRRAAAAPGGSSSARACTQPPAVFVLRLRNSWHLERLPIQKRVKAFRVNHRILAAAIRRRRCDCVGAVDAEFRLSSLVDRSTCRYSKCAVFREARGPGCRQSHHALQALFDEQTSTHCETGVNRVLGDVVWFLRFVATELSGSLRHEAGYLCQRARSATVSLARLALANTVRRRRALPRNTYR